MEAAPRARTGGAVRRLLLAHLLSVISEWAVGVGLLVFAFDRGGSTAVGAASVALLAPSILCAPLVGAVMARRRTHSVRVGAFAGQVVAFVGGAAAAAAGAPTAVVGALVILGVALTTAVPPTSVALLPRVARSTSDLITANLRLSACDAAAAVLGALASALLLGGGGPTAVFAGGAIAAAVGLAATLWRPAALARTARGDARSTSGRVVRQALAELRTSPWSRGVLGAASARNLLVGALDVLLVVIAFDALDLDESGPGYLTALVGAGALASVAVTTVVVRRARLRGGLIVAIAAAAGLVVLLGLRTERPVVFVALPVLGLAMATMDALSRTLLQRSTDPRSLGSMFAALGLVAGGGQLVGSATAQIAFAVGGLRAALVAVAAALVVLAATSARSLRRADAHAEVPSVEMALLAGLPMLTALPTAALERVARSASTLAIGAGETVVVEGDPADACFVIADGDFAVSAGGSSLRTATRGDVVGEVALLSSSTSTATVTATAPAAVLRIDRDSFLVALTGRSDPSGDDPLDFTAARERFRDVVAEELGTSTSHGRGADAWLGLGAIGRALADPTFFDALARGAALARADGDVALLAEAAVMTAWPGTFFHVAAEPSPHLVEVCDAALAKLDPDDPRRVRVLATLSTNLAFAADGARRFDLLREAHALAARLRRPDLVGVVLNAEFMCAWEPATLPRREAIAADLVEIAAVSGDAEFAFLGEFFMAYCAVERVQLLDAKRRLEALRRSVPATHNQYFEFLTDRLLLAIDLARCEPGTAERIDALAVRHETTHADTAGTWALQSGLLAFRAGTLGDLVPSIEAMLDSPHNRTWPAALALSYLEAGDADGAARMLAAQGEVPRDYFWLTVKQVQAEVAAGLGDRVRCRQLHDDLAPHRGLAGLTASGTLIYGLVSRSLGELALVLDRHEDAVDLLAEAVAVADAAGMAGEAVTARRLLAEAHFVCGHLDEANAAALAAVSMARQHGFAREAALLEELVPN